jgi:hypothetical protein
MNNFGQNLQRTSILKELSNGIVELGEGFAMALNEMVVQSGITNPRAEDFDIVSKSWRALAGKPDKTQEDFEKLDMRFKNEVKTLAESYLLFIAKEVGNLTGKLDYAQYEKYLLKYRFGHYNSMNKPEYLKEVKIQIRNAFNKISAHGEVSGGDNLIDKKDMASFVYALATKSSRDSDNNFTGFEINGIIRPQEYAVSENLLFRDDDNLFSIKLRVAYAMLFEEEK